MPVFDIRSDQLDIESLMQKVAEEVARRQAGETGRTFASASAAGAQPDLRQAMAVLNTSWNIDGNAIIHSTRPRWGRQIIRFQKAVRRLTWWFTEPILLQVRGFNGNATRATNALYRQQIELTETVEHLAARVEALEAEKRKRQGS